MRGAPASSGTDRISQLPDAVLHSILSLLPLDAAAATAILSKRWRHLFPSLPDLHFSPQSFSPISPFAKVTFFPNNWFAAAVHILNSRRGRVGRSSLRFSYNEDFKVELDDITFSLCVLGIRELALDNYAEDDRYTIPSYILSCPSLKKLEAKSCNLVIPPNVMSLYHMRSLDLFDVVVSDEHIEKLVSSCPALEELSICHCPGLHNIVIRSHSLSRLEVKDTRPLDISIEKAPCLLVVHVSFCDKIENRNEEEEEEEVEEEDEEKKVIDLVSWLVRLLDGLSCIEDLGLSFGEEYVKRLIGRGMSLPKNLPIGNRLLKLKKLHLSMPFTNGYLISILSCLLNSSPNVEELLVDEFGRKGSVGMVKAKYWDQCKLLESIVNWPITTTLRLGCKQLKHWVGFTKFLLMNARTLKKMNIFYSSPQTAEALELSEFENDQKELLLLQKDFPHVVLKLTSSLGGVWF